MIDNRPISTRFDNTEEKTIKSGGKSKNKTDHRI